MINAGGLINVANELEGHNRDFANEQATRIYDTMTAILDLADAEKISTYEASTRMAERRLSQIGHIKHLYATHSNITGRLGEVGRTRT